MQEQHSATHDAAGAPKGKRRSQRELAALSSRVIACLTDQPGLRIDELERHLSATGSGFRSRLYHMVTSHVLRTEGGRRYRRYFVAVARGTNLVQPQSADRPVSEHGELAP